jgi:hypothetical protein
MINSKQDVNKLRGVPIINQKEPNEKFHLLFFS